MAIDSNPNNGVNNSVFSYGSKNITLFKGIKFIKSVYYGYNKLLSFESLTGKDVYDKNLIQLVNGSSSVVYDTELRISLQSSGEATFKIPVSSIDLSLENNIAFSSYKYEIQILNAYGTEISPKYIVEATETALASFDYYQVVVGNTSGTYKGAETEECPVTISYDFEYGNMQYNFVTGKISNPVYQNINITTSVNNGVYIKIKNIGNETSFRLRTITGQISSSIN